MMVGSDILNVYFILYFKRLSPVISAPSWIHSLAENQRWIRAGFPIDPPVTILWRSFSTKIYSFFIQKTYCAYKFDLAKKILSYNFFEPKIEPTIFLPLLWTL